MNTNTAGGIGAVGAQQHDDVLDETPEVGIDLRSETPPLRRAIETVTPDGVVHEIPLRPGAEDMLREVSRAADKAVSEWLTDAGDRLAAIETSLAQLQGQHTQVEMALPQYGHALQTLDARLTAIAQQVARNFRLAALDAATRTAGPGLQTADIIARAETFLRWIDPPPADVQQPAPSLDDAEAVRH